MQLLFKRYLFLLAATAIFVYANTLVNGYVLDDLAVIKQHEYVAKGVEGIPDILSTPYLKGFRKNNDNNDYNDVYRPLSLVMFAVEHSVFGDAPAGSHLVNILLFAGCVLLLFVFLDGLFENKKTAIVFVACFLFAVHPIHTEVVANIKSRDELLCFFLAFLSLISFSRFARNGRTLPLLAGVLCYFLSLLSRETSISFLFIIPLTFFFYLNSNKKRSAIITLTSVIAAIVYLTIRHIVLKNNHAGYTGDISLIDNALVGAPSLSSRIATAILILGYYIKLLIVPYPLVSEYGYNTIPPVNFSSFSVVISILAYGFLIGIGIYRLIRQKKDVHAFGILFFLATLALFSNLFFLIGSTMAERFLFFASAGFCLCIAQVLWKLMGSDTDETHIPGRLWFVIGPMAALFSFLTISRNVEWKDNYSLFSADVRKSPNTARLWHSLGYETATTLVEDEPSSADKIELLREGIADIQHAITIYPSYTKARFDLGNIFVRVQQYDSAAVHFNTILTQNPNDVAAVSALGYVYFLKKEYPKTIALCRRALQIDSGSITVLNNMAICYLQMKQYDSAIAVAKYVLAKSPADKLATESLNAAYNGLKNVDTLKR